MKIVIDTSAAIEVALNRQKSEAISKLLSQADVVLSPDLFVAEASNTFWKYYKIVGLPLVRCEQGLSDVLNLVDEFVPTLPLAQEVFSASCIVQHSAYDLFFAILARRMDAILISIDEKLINCCKNLGVKTEL
jgi:predicted nucleic acid-binding protein